VLLLTSLLFFTFGYLSAQEWGKVEGWEWALEPPPEIPDEPALIIFDRGDMKVDLEGITLMRHVRIKVFDKDNIDDVANIDISYHGDQKFSKFKAHTILPNGDKNKIKDEFEKKAGNLKTVAFTFPSIINGCILEYQYQIFHENFGFLEPWYFQNDIYTLKSIFSVTLYPGFEYATWPINIPAHQQQSSRLHVHEFGRLTTRYTWELDSLIPVKAEPFAGAVSNYTAALHFQIRSFKGTGIRFDFPTKWKEIGIELNKIIDEFIDDEDELEELSGKLTAGALNEDEKIAHIYDYVRDSILTRGSGMLDFSEDKFSNLMDNRYGSATAKNLLLTALLQKAGFKAHPLLIGTRGFCKFNPAHVQLNQFNHLVCYVNLKIREYLLDAGNRAVAFPYVPASDRIRSGLLIDAEASRPISLLPPPKRKSSTQLKANINLREDGSAACSTFICVQGYENARYDDYLLDTISQQQIATDILDEFELNYDVEEAVSRYFPEGDSLSIKLVIEIPEFASALGDHMLISPFLIPLVNNPFKSEERQYPIDFQYEFTRYHEITINLPENMIVGDLPDKINRNTDCGKYTRSFLTTGNSIAAILYFKLNKETFLPSEYPGVKEMFDEITETSKDEIAVIVQE